MRSFKDIQTTTREVTDQKHMADKVTTDLLNRLHHYESKIKDLTLRNSALSTSKSVVNFD